MVNDNEITYNQSDFLAPILKRKCKYGGKGMFLSQNFLPKTYCATLKPMGSGHFVVVPLWSSFLMSLIGNLVVGVVGSQTSIYSLFCFI